MAEKRLIDASGLLDKIDKTGKGTAYEGTEYAAWQGGVEYVAAMIEDAPTISIESLHPVAYWEECDYTYLDDAGEVAKIHKGGLCCSRCRSGFKKAHLELLWVLKCCPNCGALMVSSKEAKEKLQIERCQA